MLKTVYGSMIATYFYAIGGRGNILPRDVKRRANHAERHVSAYFLLQNYPNCRELFLQDCTWGGGGTYLWHCIPSFSKDFDRVRRSAMSV